MSRFSVEAVFKAIDHMTAPIAKMQGSTTSFSKHLRRDFAKAQRSVENFNRSVRQKTAQGLKMALTGGVMALGVGLGYVAREFVNFDHAIVSATAKFNDLVPGSENAKKAMEELREVARKIGAETQFTPTDAAKGLDFLAMAGFKSKQAMALLPGVVNLATIANTDLGRATDIASDMLGAFGMATKEALDNPAILAKNFTRVQDVVAKTITSTNTNMEDLFEAMKFGGPAFTSAGQSLETFNAIAGRMASSGIKGSNAGTALRSAMVRLQKPTKDVLLGLQQFGLSQEDLIKDGKLMDMVDIMKLMEERGKGLTDVQRNSALSAITGKNAFSAWAAVFKEGVWQSEALKKSLQNSTGASAAMSAEIRKSLLNRLKSLGSAATELGFKFMVAFEKQGGNAIDKLTKFVRDFDPTPIIEGLKFIAKVFVFVIGVIRDFWPLIVTLIAIWKGYQAVLFVAAAAQQIMNVVMMANPIGLIIIGVALLIAGIVTLYRNWDSLSLKAKIFFGILSFALMGPFGLIIVGFIALAKHVGGVQNAFIVLGKIIVRVLLAPINLLILSIEGILYMMSKIPGVGGKFKGAYEAVSGFRGRINKPFEITEFEEKKRESFGVFKSMMPENMRVGGQGATTAGSGQAPTTSRSVFSSTIEKMQKQIVDININNQSDNPVNVGRGRPIHRGSRAIVPASGSAS